MKNIVHLITGLSIGGAEIALFRLVERLNRKTFRSQVISMTSIGVIGEAIKTLGIPVLALGMIPGRPDPLALLRLAAWLRQNKPDLIQTWLYHADLLGLFASGLAGRPPVVWNLRASDMDMSQYRRLSSWTVRACARLSRKPRAVIVNSQAGRRYHEQIGYRPRRWVLIPNGIDTNQFKPDGAAKVSVRQELGLESTALLIGYVARFDPMKDHETFLRGARNLLETNPEVHFMLCGSDVNADNPTIASLVESLGIKQHVHLLGRREDIPRLTAALDIACSASVSEGFPNVVAEAMACGVPSVVTDVGDSAMIVGETGLVVPSKDPRALAKAWLELIQMGSDERVALGLAARRRVEEHYNLPQIVSQYQKLYEELLAG